MYVFQILLRCKMKKFNSLMILLLIGFAFSCKETNSVSGSDPDINYKPLTQNQIKTARASNETGLKILKLLKDDESNYLISPISIHYAVAMAYNGAKGETKEEMANALSYSGIDLATLNQDYENLTKLLLNSDSKVKMSIANSIWNRPDCVVEDDYLNILKSYFSAESYTKDFSAPSTLTEINKWVSDNTKGKIDKIIDEISPEAVLYLINAIYFKADWTKKFEKSLTDKGEFNNVNGTNSQVDMMYMHDSLISTYSDDKIKAIDLQYGKGNYTMTFILTNSTQLLNSYLDDFSIEKYQNIISGMKIQEAIIQIPKFKIEYKTELQDLFPLLGMKKAFTGSADFSGITKSFGIFISRIIHKTFMEVDEEGTTAAAVTAIEMKNTSVPDYFTFTANKPFIIVLREKTSNAILFVGRINKL